jgi:hypothetical protein
VVDYEFEEEISVGVAISLKNGPFSGYNKAFKRINKRIKV